MVQDFDDVLQIVGLGKWNLLYYSALGLCVFMIPSFLFAGTFIAPNVDFECDTRHVEEIIQDQDQCTYIVFENTTLGEEYDVERQCSEWIYNGTYFTNTLTSEFNLVCAKAYLRPTFQTLLIIGNLIGSPTNGFLSDRYGRKMLVTITSLITVGSVFVSTFAQNFTVILILRFLTGVTCFALFHTGYILCMEVCEPKHRSAVGILTFVPWAFGAMWWGILGYLIKDWRWLMRATTVPAIIYFICLCLMDESPRWLIVRGYHRKALRALQKAATWNHSSLPSEDELLKRMVAIQESSRSQEESQEKAKSSSCCTNRIKAGMNQIIILYKTPELRKRTLLMYIDFLISAVVYHGLSLNAVNFQLDPFMYMIIGGLCEIPAYTITVPIIEKFGRVPPTAACYFICGITILILAFITSVPTWLMITLAMIGKFCISAAYQLIFLIASEVFPTEVRLQGLGTSSFVSTFGATAVPFITDLIGSHYPWVPSVIFGGLSILAGIASVFIPETLNKHLPEKVRQLEWEAKDKKNRQNPEENEIFEVT